MTSPADVRQREFVFTQADFESLRALVKEQCGITLSDSKRELVYGRLSRRLRALGIGAFADYRRLLASREGQAETIEFINAVTTNLTSFFREPHHFDFLRDTYLRARAADARGSRRMRIWCCAASTGEEPYSIAMSVAEAIPDWQRWDIKILATDLDTQVLKTCVAGVYREDRVSGMPRARVERFFDVSGPAGDRQFRVKREVASMISFRQLNLMHALPMKGPLDVIFCRNVIIYFDKETQRALFARMAPLQRPGDVLCLGHSESLLQVSDAWTLMGKTIYKRNAPC
ncbi:MAG TPA: protein-glutamate O-methyltransferase CheR [Steroidobacteraceae bacterium]|nr:protein-glutamate O-methyltransferase CheR [Steroidobacteraceae bacterium]